MEYASWIQNEPDAIQPTLSSYECDAALLTNGHGTLYGCPFFNSSGYHQEGLLRAIIPSPCGQEEPVVTSRPWNEYEETEAAYNGYENWLSRYNSVFNGCWEENYGSLGNEINNNESGCNSKKSEDYNRSEEQCNSQFSRHDENEDEDEKEYNPWSCCDKWSEYEGEKEETDEKYDRHLREVEVFEGIFGYWPCLYRRN